MFRCRMLRSRLKLHNKMRWRTSELVLLLLQHPWDQTQQTLPQNEFYPDLSPKLCLQILSKDLIILSWYKMYIWRIKLLPILASFMFLFFLLVHATEPAALTKHTLLVLKVVVEVATKNFPSLQNEPLILWHLLNVLFGYLSSAKLPWRPNTKMIGTIFWRNILTDVSDCERH